MWGPSLALCGVLTLVLWSSAPGSTLSPYTITHHVSGIKTVTPPSNIYVARGVGVPEGMTGLRVNGKRAIRARWPNGDPEYQVRRRGVLLPHVGVGLLSHIYGVLLTHVGIGYFCLTYVWDALFHICTGCSSPLLLPRGLSCLLRGVPTAGDAHVSLSIFPITKLERCAAVSIRKVLS